jgi:predicted oxidoreductase
VAALCEHARGRAAGSFVLRNSNLLIVILSLGILQPLVGFTKPEQPSPHPNSAAGPDLIVVGAGLAGLSAALEAGRSGAKVLVLDEASVFGGHAVMSAGDVAIIDTPLQRSKNIHDSPALAYDDFMRWGVDADAAWVRYYVDHSQTEIYDWLTALGVKFKGVGRYPGNSVPRAHKTSGLGLGLVRPVYLECLRNPNISFVWNTEATRLLLQQGAVKGLQGVNLRTQRLEEFRSKAVILATGGFQSNVELALEHWPAGLPKPTILLAGSGVNSKGSGLKLATDVGAALSNLDHQWNYERGLPDPRYPGMNRGLNASVDGLRVNALGQELMIQDAASDELLRQVLDQPGATYWMIFDEKLKHTFGISGSDWGNFDTIQRRILDNPSIVKKASSLDDLALQTGIPVDALKQSVSKHNEREQSIDTAPYYAAQFYPMTRKSMGGIAIDPGARVLDRQSHSIPGLYAAGEATGEAGINGKRALEGTFLGPAVVTGRVAARSAIRDFSISRVPSLPFVDNPASGHSTVVSCSSCHPLATLIAKPRIGYWHFERAHKIVLESNRECTQCHSGMGEPLTPQHRINPLIQANSCSVCHQSN